MKITIQQCISIAISLLACAGCQPKMVELKTDLPPSKIDRTPQDPIGKQGEAFFVPRGTKLLSRGVDVTSSDDFPIFGEIEMITDGNEKVPDWRDNGVELMDGLQWVQLDLGKPYALYAILVWHYYSPESEDYSFGWEYTWNWSRMYQDVVVQVSNDPAFEKDVKTVFNNDHNNSSGLGTGEDDTYVETSAGCWIDPKGVEGRYVRLYSNGYTRQWRGGGIAHFDQYIDLNNYIEVEVYGIPK